MIFLSADVGWGLGFEHIAPKGCSRINRSHGDLTGSRSIWLLRPTRLEIVPACGAGERNLAAQPEFAVDACQQGSLPG